MSIKNLEDYQQEEEQEDNEEAEVIEDNGFRELYENQEQFMRQINQLNHQGVLKIKLQKYQEAMKLLQQSEQMLEYATSCGKQIDKNLIIVILYNQACSYQCQWILDKSSKYLTGVIYNLDESMKDEDVNNNIETNEEESDATQVKKKSFLARASLQHTAILSQLGKHKQALQSARKAAETMREVFKIASQFCNDWVNKNGSLESSATTHSFMNYKSKQKNAKYQMKDEVEFSRLVINSGNDTLLDMLRYQDLDNMSNNEQLILREAKKQLYYWKNNPTNNEKHIRQELKINNKPDDYRSILGVQNVEEWIQSFNVSFIMHMTPLIHSEFAQQGEMLYEISKRMLLEKIIQLSISYFTIATELRFIELEKAKQQGTKDFNTEEFKLSELYHLKAIEIACKHIACSSQYINHLITTYHKHYNSNLDTIQEESITTIVSEFNYKEQKLQQLKQMQMQTQRENQLLLQKITEKKLNDSSPTGRLVNSLQGQISPLKNSRNISDNIKTQANFLDQMIRNKRRQQMPSDISPKQKFQFLNLSTNNSCEKVNEKVLKMKDTLTIQLQPYKSAKATFNHIIKYIPFGQQNNNGLVKSFLLESCRVQRQNFVSNCSPKRGGRSPRQSPDKSYVNYKTRTSIPQNKQNIPNLEIESQFPIKLETLKQSLIGKSFQNKKRK
ncbi:unnamed protein product (macronuclear) [Paramecium tetraurelia]|uniref:BRO1 domain-containing protein n=1 Tax=Paramecium tetraurelia TaxID=5888 RepID=A0DJ22_PARTE|nr:uncharacterized protein GSPATT00017396001 [Paramecium tetraurelia]CAK83039.1 unnamed protein product [Paramecium tetraurelia]|eukprot:XP_001450436.1 hypothetical protein (macronuclear) [Paramecium tetraurelia strain d4-2]